MKEVYRCRVLGRGAEKEKGHGAVRLNIGLGQPAKIVRRQLIMSSLINVRPPLHFSLISTLF